MNEQIHVSRRGKLLIGLALVIVWSTFVYFSYAYSKNYFDSSIKTLDDKYYKNYEATRSDVNDLKEDIATLKYDISILNGSINAFNDNMTQIFEDVSGIDSVINDTSVLQKATSQKLEELDIRLIELIKNLEILRKAPNE
ncbi:MAG: hypothetical protein WBA54_07375 [Acidaminobacteraceae bacterium]